MMFFITKGKRIERRLNYLIERMETIMATLEQVLADTTAMSTRLDSVAALIGGLQQQIAEALSGVTLAPAVQAQVDAIFAAAEGNLSQIDAALNANVPAPEPVAPEPAAAPVVLAADGLIVAPPTDTV